MKNLEKVEAYFNNELNDSEKNDFLNKVESNSELKKEFDFQSEVINGIKEARMAELKAMLNKVPISAISTATNGLYKIMYGGTVAILLGTTFWYYSNSEDIIADTPETKITVNEPINDTEDKLVTTKPTSQAFKTPVSKESRKVAQIINNKDRAPIIKPNVPTSEDRIDSNVILEENLEIPDVVSNSSINLGNKVNVEVKLKKKYDFHYQYSEKGIVLYGDFKEGLFEILELNKEESTNYYLYYKSNFYYIKDSTGKITTLKPVNNKSLKIKLEALR